VRELPNAIKRALTMVRRKILSVDDLPDELVARAGHLLGHGADGFFQLRDRHVAKFEREYFYELLSNFRGDVSRAARDAHIPRGTLYRFLRKHELDPEHFRD
jgi:two-component system response regulator GlrR